MIFDFAHITQLQVNITTQMIPVDIKQIHLLKQWTNLFLSRVIYSLHKQDVFQCGYDPCEHMLVFEHELKSSEVRM